MTRLYRSGGQNGNSTDSDHEEDNHLAASGSLPSLPQSPADVATRPTKRKRRRARADPVKPEQRRKEFLKRMQGIHQSVCQLALQRTACFLQCMPTDHGQWQWAYILWTRSTSALHSIESSVLYGSQ